MLVNVGMVNKMAQTKEEKAAYDRAYREKNKELIAAKYKVYYEKNKAHKNEVRKEWHLKNKARQNARSLKYYADNTLHLQAKNKEWRENNKEHLSSYRQSWGADNKEHLANYTVAYRATPEGRMVAVKANAKRRAAKINRTPTWLSDLDKWLIDEIYILSALRTELTGVEWHVDHIIPLQGEIVSGLHVPSNLQVITAKENLIKGNRL